MALVVGVGGCIEYFAEPPDLGPIPGVDGGVRCGAERADAAVPPCNGCPDGTVVPTGWVCIPPGMFTMGSPPDVAMYVFANEGPERRVVLTRPLLMQATEVTVGEWGALIDINPSNLEWCDPAEPEAADACPVERVNWWEAVEYANRASQRDGLSPCYELTNCIREPGQDMECVEVEWVRDCEGYRLPTEAEWEYAARAGAESHGSVDEEVAALAGMVWHDGNSGDPPHPHPVGRLGANAWGLFDVHGNVYEWVWDRFGDYPAEGPDTPLAATPLADPVGPATGDKRVIRGGSFYSHVSRTRSGHRSPATPNHGDAVNGFRLARPAPSLDP